MDSALKTRVRARARDRCEYCRFPERESSIPFSLDHVKALQHRGETDAANLALACASCNAHKGPNSAGFDPETGAHVRLFNPRIDRWYEHFRWDGIQIVGLTEIGRATVVLNLNGRAQLIARTALLRSGWFFRADL
jgi:hypothetical protein